MEKKLRREIINYKSRNSKRGYEFDINKQKMKGLLLQIWKQFNSNNCITYRFKYSSFILHQRYKR